MHNEININRYDDMTTLTTEDNDVIAVAKDINKHNDYTNGIYYLLDCEPIYTVKDGEEIFFASEKIGTEEMNDEVRGLVDFANSVLRSDENLHDWILKNDEKYTLCFHSKYDHNGNKRIVLVYAIDKGDLSIKHVKDLDDIQGLDTTYLIKGENGLGDAKSLTGWHFSINTEETPERKKNPLYETFEWIRDDPTNKELIIQNFFTENFVTTANITLDSVNRYVYNTKFIDTIISMRENYQKLLDDLIAVDMGIARIYNSNKPDNVVALETNNLFMKYNFGFMVNRRYTDIKYMKTLLVSSIIKMETEI